MYGSVRGAARKGRSYRDGGIQCGARSPGCSDERNDPPGKPKAPG
jgi:hypothetical protein